MSEKDFMGELFNKIDMDSKGEKRTERNETPTGDITTEIVKMQSKILVQILKDNPAVVLKAIKTLNIRKDDLRKLMG